MLPDIEHCLLKKDKQPADYQLLIGYFWSVYCSNPTDKDVATLKQLITQYELKFNRKASKLSILKNNILYQGIE
jgi:hypothetical protein